MKNFSKGKFGTVVILFFTVILAGVAIFTAVRLYQLRQQPVAPNVPSSIPHAQEATPAPGACSLTFTVTASTTPTPTPTPVPQCNDICSSDNDCPSTLSCSSGHCRNTQCTAEVSCVCPTATPTATPNPSGTPNSCGGTCGSNVNCGGGLYCYTTLGLCRNPSCPSRTDCNCPSGSTSTPISTPTPAAAALPNSGTDWPTVLGAGIGIFVVIGSLLLAI